MVGFVLVFSLVLTTIGIVYVGGLASLEDSREAEQINNAERAFDVLAENFQKQARDEAPNRATEIKLSEAQLSTGEARRISANTPDLAFSVGADRNRAIIFDTGAGSQIVYEHGAVIRVDGEDSTMVREPDFLIDSDRTVLRYIETVGGGQSIGGETTVLVRSSIARSELLHTETDPDEVTLRVRTAEQRAEAWERYLEAETPNPDSCEQIVDPDGVTAVECQFDTASLHIALTRISVDFT